VNGGHAFDHLPFGNPALDALSKKCRLPHGRAFTMEAMAESDPIAPVIIALQANISGHRAQVSWEIVHVLGCRSRRGRTLRLRTDLMQSSPPSLLTNIF
jgi:hypothetical protein